MPNRVIPGQASVNSSESEDDLMDEVDKIMSSVFGHSTSDADDNEKVDDDSSLIDANSDIDISSGDDDMEVDTTW